MRTTNYGFGSGTSMKGSGGGSRNGITASGTRYSGSASGFTSRDDAERLMNKLGVINYNIDTNSLNGTSKVVWPRDPMDEMLAMYNMFYREPQDFSGWLKDNPITLDPVLYRSGFYDILNGYDNANTRDGNYLPAYYDRAEKAARADYKTNVYDRIPESFAAPGGSPFSGAAALAKGRANQTYFAQEAKNRLDAVNQATQVGAQLYEMERKSREMDLQRKLALWASEQGFDQSALQLGLSAAGLGLNYGLEQQQNHQQMWMFYKALQAQKDAQDQQRQNSLGGMAGGLAGLAGGALLGGGMSGGAGGMMGGMLGSQLGSGLGVYAAGGVPSPYIVPAMMNSLMGGMSPAMFSGIGGMTTPTANPAATGELDAAGQVNLMTNNPYASFAPYLMGI